MTKARSLRILLENSPDGFFVHDEKGRILDVNARSCADLGYPRDELLGMNIADLSLGAALAELETQWARLPPGEAITQQETALRKDGSTFPAEVRISCQIIDGQKLFLGLARDVTEAVEARAAIQRLNGELALRVEERTGELREARERLQVVMDSAHEAICFQDRAGRFLLFNRAAEAFSGIASADVIGRTTVDVFGTDVGGKARAEEERVMATGVPSTIEESLLVDGSPRIFLTTRSPALDKSGMVSGTVCLARDVTDIKRTEHRIRQEHGRLLLAAQVGGIGVWEYDIERDALECDERWYRIMGRDPAQPIRSIAEFRPLIHPEDVDRATEVTMTVAELVSSGQDYGIVFRIVRPNGEIRWIRSAACLIDDAAGMPRRAVGFVVDVTERLLAEEALRQTNLSLLEENLSLVRQGEELARQSFEDSLTGIANRRRLDQELERACLQARRTGEPLTLAMFDIDFFKQYNDRYGHIQGDVALHAVAQVLASAARRPYDFAARYGGEEFVLLLRDTDRPEVVLEKIKADIAALKLPHAGSSVSPYLTLSCGSVRVASAADIAPANLLARCDAMLYRAKQNGRNCFMASSL